MCACVCVSFDNFTRALVALLKLLLVYRATLWLKKKDTEK